MGDLKHYQSRGSVIAQKTDGNPEGKGHNGFLLDWYQSEPRGVVAKPQRQVLAEFFTSMLVLSAKFKYKPVVGVANYLYQVNGVWSLSLIVPGEWSDEMRAGFAGMPYYQRLYASALSRSIRGSVTLGDQLSIRCRHWRMRLPRPEQTGNGVELLGEWGSN